MVQAQIDALRARTAAGDHDAQELLQGIPRSTPSGSTSSDVTESVVSTSGVLLDVDDVLELDFDDDIDVSQDDVFTQAQDAQQGVAPHLGVA